MKNRLLPLKLSVIIGGIVLIILSVSWIDKYQASGQRDDDSGTNSVKNAAEYYAVMKRNQVTGVINPNEVFQARKQVQDHMANSGRGFNMAWQFLGPDNWGGRTRAILLDKTDETYQTLFAGGVSGGVWKSTTGGLTWNKVNTPQENISVSCMAQGPNGDIYVGTGEYFVVTEDFQISRYEGFIGHGILHSSDGENFNFLAPTIPGHGQGMDAEWAYVNELAVGENNGRIFAATNTGLKFSNDGGANWSFAKTAEGDLLDTIATDVHVAANGLIVASVRNWCYVSENGDPFNFISQSTRYDIPPDSVVNPEKLPMEKIARIEFAIAPSDNNVVYAMAASDDDFANNVQFGELEGIYRSADKGQTWDLIGPGGSANFNVLGFQVGNDQFYLGFYNNTLTVHPQDAGRIIVGGYDMWEGNYPEQTGFFDWVQTSTSFFPGLFNYIHSSHHAYVFNPDNPNTCYFASDGGINVTNDGFESFKDLNKNYNVDQFYSIAYKNDGLVMGGTQGSGVLYISGEGNTPYNAEPMNIGQDINGGFTEFSMIDPDIFFFAGEHANIRRWDDDIGAFTAFLIATITNPNAFITPFALWEDFNNENSRDSVTYIADKNYNANDTIVAYSNNNSYPIVYVLPEPLLSGDSTRVHDPVSSLFFVAVNDIVWMTKQAIDLTVVPEWWEISNFDGLPWCIGYSADANYLYVGTEEGLLYRIANIALAYDYDRADVNSSSCIISTQLIKDFEGRVITSVAVDPENDNNVAVTLGNYGNSDYVYWTSNAVDSIPDFVSVQGNLPQMPVYSSLVEFNSANLIIGSECGIWVTDNPQGNTTEWSMENDGMDAVPVFMLRQQQISQWPINNFGIIYAATHGTGLYQSDRYVGIADEPQPSSVVNKNLKIYPNPVTENATIEFEMDKVADVIINIYDINSRLVKQLDLNQSLNGSNQIIIDCHDLMHGTYVLQLLTGAETYVTKFIVLK